MLQLVIGILMTCLAAYMSGVGIWAGNLELDVVTECLIA